MQVGTLGYINSMVTMSSDQFKPTTGFVGILDSLRLQEESQNKSFGEEQQNQMLLKAEIAELIDYLNQTSKSELLLHGADINGLNSEESTIEDSSGRVRLTTELLQITDEELKASIETFLTKHTRSSFDVSDEQGHVELVKFMEELPEMEPVEALQSFIALLPFIDLEQIQLSVEKDQLPLLKALKMVELLSQDLTEESKAGIQDFLQKVSKKLEEMIKDNKTPSRLEVWSKVFTPLVEELNGQQLKNNNVHLDDTTISNINLIYTKKQTTLTEKKVHLVNVNRMPEMYYETNGIAVNHKLQQKATGDGGQGLISKIIISPKNSAGTELELREDQAIKSTIPISPENGTRTELEPTENQAVRSRVLTTTENSTGTELEPSGDQAIRSKLQASPENGTRIELVPTENQAVRSRILTTTENSTGTELEPSRDQAIKSTIPTSPENGTRTELEPTENQAVRSRILASIENSIGTKLNQKGSQNQAGQQSELDVNLTNKAFLTNQGNSLQKLNAKMDVRSLIQNSINDARIKIANQHHPTESANGSLLPLQFMTRPEQLTMMLDSSGKMISVEQLIQQFESIFAKSHFVKNGGTQRIFVKLNPESLGALRIEIIQKNATLIARIQTTTSVAKDALESQLQNLRHALHSQNIVVDKIEISQQLIQQERFFNRDPQQQHEQGQHRGQQDQKQQNDQPQETSFQEALLNIEV